MVGPVAGRRRRSEPAVGGSVRLDVLRVGDFLPGRGQDVGQPAFLETQPERCADPVAGIGDHDRRLPLGEGVEQAERDPPHFLVADAARYSALWQRSGSLVHSRARYICHSSGQARSAAGSNGPILLAGGKFRSTASFDFSTFLRPLLCRSLFFHGHAGSHGVTFREGAEFSNVTFMEGVELPGALVAGERIDLEVPPTERKSDRVRSPVTEAPEGRSARRQEIRSYRAPSASRSSRSTASVRFGLSMRTPNSTLLFSALQEKFALVTRRRW